MDITFENFLPNVIEDKDLTNASLWRTNLLIQSPQKIVVNAPSGKGKSTLVSILLGLRRDYTGSVCYNGSSISELTKQQWTEIRRSKIAVVFQDLQLLSNLTVKENLLLKNNLTNCFTESEIYSLLDKVGLSQKWEVSCDTLSYGQQQRVAIVRALLQPFEWIVLDEPFSHLDKANSRKCLDLIESRCKELGAGFIITSLDKDDSFQLDKELVL
jgi:ABC-type lipoprotein export system ATPase subunit